MTATDTKEANAATPEIIDEVCQKTVRCSEKRGEELIETFNRMSDRTIDLFEKTLSVYQAASMPGAQRRVRDLIENSPGALPVKVQSARNTNAEIIASPKQLADRLSMA